MAGRGRPPIGKQAMTDAERQRRRRARLRASQRGADRDPAVLAHELAAAKARIAALEAELGARHAAEIARPPPPPPRMPKQRRCSFCGESSAPMVSGGVAHICAGCAREALDLLARV
jgi:hypothetical protein